MIIWDLAVSVSTGTAEEPATGPTTSAALYVCFSVVFPGARVGFPSTVVRYGLVADELAKLRDPSPSSLTYLWLEVAQNNNVTAKYLTANLHLTTALPLSLLGQIIQVPEPPVYNPLHTWSPCCPKSRREAKNRIHQ